MNVDKKTVTIENVDVELELSFFYEKDLNILSDIYKKWVELSNLIQKNGGRRINFRNYFQRQSFATILKQGALQKVQIKSIHLLIA